MPRKKTEDSAAVVPHRVTQQDIANIAGVHKMTVSDALKGTGRVDPSTRERIQQIARELNYVPNPAARALATGRTGNIVLISGPVYKQYYARMVHNLETHINHAGYQLVLMRTRTKVRDLVTSNSSLSADGVIVIDTVAILDEFRSHPNFPCVAIGTSEHDFIDNVQAEIGPSLNHAIFLMRESGRRRIALVVTHTSIAARSDARARTYYEALEVANLESEIINLDSDDPTVIEIRLERYIREKGSPDGLVCENDDIAICALAVMQRLGYKVPDDVMLVGCAGCDGQTHLKYFDPPISTVVLPMAQMCAVAWQFLERRMTDMSLPHQQVSIPSKLILTSSLIPMTGRIPDET
ncbi:LacI family transcriptional regulator [bacterium]|nr:MAG: LacI family transcriptional regulator [bacterium]